MKRPTSLCQCDAPTKGDWHGIDICTRCLCYLPSPNYSPSGITDTPDGFIVGGAPAPTGLLHQQIVPNSRDIGYWAAEADRDRRRRQVASATFDGNGTDAERLQAEAIIELARRELRGEG